MFLNFKKISLIIKAFIIHFQRGTHTHTYIYIHDVCMYIKNPDKQNRKTFTILSIKIHTLVHRLYMCVHLYNFYKNGSKTHIHFITCLFHWIFWWPSMPINVGLQHHFQLLTITLLEFKQFPIVHFHYFKKALYQSSLSIIHALKCNLE